MRKARKKVAGGIYHITCKSIPEVLLFRDADDKKRYENTLKKYADKYNCKIYHYCMMDNHVHIHLNPQDYDISTFMKGINVSYARYYSKKYNRKGHLFHDRFFSEIADTEAYNLAISAYIHNNPKDIEGYRGREETYKYSSYGIYIGTDKDVYGVVDKTFIMGLFGTSDEEIFAKKYIAFAQQQNELGVLHTLSDKLEISAENDYISGLKTIIRDHCPSKIISYISDRLMMDSRDISIKFKRNLINFRSVVVYVLRVFCGLSYKDICSNMFNITISGCSRLFNKGYKLIKNSEYRELFDELIQFSA